MTKKLKEVQYELLSNTNKIRKNEEFKAFISSIITNIKNAKICGDMLIKTRIKAPISLLIKFIGGKKYQTKWNAMKDIAGIMLVVKDNNQVDKVLKFMEDNYKNLQNPCVVNFMEDYRIKSNRENKILQEKFIVQRPQGRNYQTTDGYKSTKVNLMWKDIPIEIQVMTKAQYIANKATHDTIYKTTQIANEDERLIVSDKFFPYFETFAYLRFNKNKLSEKQLEKVKRDIQKIYERNFFVYSQYADLFNDARAQWAIAFFFLKHEKDFKKYNFFSNTIDSPQIIYSQIKQVYDYFFDVISLKNPSLLRTQIVNKAASKLLKLSYDNFAKIREEIAGEYRQGSCIVTGDFDVIKPEHIKLLSELSKTYKEVTIGIISDQIVKAYMGVPPVYDEQTRQCIVRYIKGVTGAFIINEKNICNMANEAEDQIVRDTLGPVQFEDQEKKTYDLAYVSGIYDTFDKEQLEHLEAITKNSEKVYIGVKKSSYLKNEMHKAPINTDEERLTVIEGIRGVTRAFLTSSEIMPPKYFLKEAEKTLERGGSVAIYLNPKLKAKVKVMTKKIKREIYYIRHNYPKIKLVTIPKVKDLVSKSFRNNVMINKKNNRNGGSIPLEIIKR